MPGTEEPILSLPEKLPGKPKRKYYVNGGLTEEGDARMREAVAKKVCPFHGVPLPPPKRIWCGEGLQVRGGAISCYWAFQQKYGKIQDWKALRAQILERDHYRCVNCGAGPRRWWDSISDFMLTGDQPKMEVDHIVEIQDGGAEFDPANLRSMCHDCHAEKTAARRRSKRAENRSRRSHKIEEFLPHDSLPTDVS